MSIDRRTWVKGVGSMLVAAGSGMPLSSRAQAGPIRIGLMTVKSGPLASGGLDMERALNMYLQERNHMLAGRRVE